MVWAQSVGFGFLDVRLPSLDFLYIYIHTQTLIYSQTLYQTLSVSITTKAGLDMHPRAPTAPMPTPLSFSKPCATTSSPRRPQR